MDKCILKKFAIESRQDLMEKIRNKIKTFYVDEDFANMQKGDVYILSNNKHTLSLTIDEYKKRELLIKRIKELSEEQVIEEAAYTWFNRIVAIRYMEINDILPLSKNNQSLGIRVLSSRDNTPDPEILKFSNLSHPDLDINLNKNVYISLKNEEEKYRYLLLLVCKKLGNVIPQVFDGITDYIDILIPDNLLNDSGYIKKIVCSIPENDFKNGVEIIGWLYQYYNQTEKDKVMANKKVYQKNEIPYVTQLFTPDWIVKYMVDNSVGKYIDNSIDFPYCLPRQNNFKLLNDIEKIKIIDPCCGSGHILVYIIEVLYKIYEKNGYNKNDIIEQILKNNLFGIDIDERAVQLSLLSVILKSRELDKNIFNKSIIRELNIISINESNNISESIIENVGLSEDENVKYLIKSFINAKDIGSLLKLEKRDYTQLKDKLLRDDTLFGFEVRNKILPIIKCAELLTNEYDFIITNPPYMNTSTFNNILKKYVSKNYSNSKTDLYACFMELPYLKTGGYQAMINQHGWMFLSSFEELRKNFLNENTIKSMIHLGTRAFEEIGGEVVQTTTFVFKKQNENVESEFIKLTDYSNPTLKEQKYIEIINNINNSNDVYFKNQKDFLNIPGYSLSYWINDDIIQSFNNQKLGVKYQPRQGMSTTDNNKYVRKWYEVDYNKICFDISKKDDYRWFMYNKSGEYKKWYGNFLHIVDYEDNGNVLINMVKEKYPNISDPEFIIKNRKYYFKDAITWSMVSTNNFACRFVPKGTIPDISSPCIFEVEDKYYYLALLNSCLTNEILGMINPTMNYNVGDVANLPIKYPEDIKIKNRIEELSEINTKISKENWDIRETSWDFKKHIYLETEIKENLLSNCYKNYKKYVNNQKDNIISNEKEMNKLILDVYNVSSLNNKIDNSNNTLDILTEKDMLKTFIQYFIGCLFGRYSIEKEGIICSSSKLEMNNYDNFDIDVDNIVPITDEYYFADDIIAKYRKFLEVVFDKDNVNKNLDYTAEIIGKKGTETSEDTIRRYFLNDFFNDHCKIYQKRPIYWLFDSGKKNGFKALVYMHRYNENLIPKVRLDYLHRVQTTYEKLLSDVNYKLTTDLSMTDKKTAQNRQADLNAKLNEIKEYDEKIAHIANQRISIDLDDGVKVNYEKFKDILAKIK